MIGKAVRAGKPEERKSCQSGKAGRTEKLSEREGRKNGKAVRAGRPDKTDSSKIRIKTPRPGEEFRNFPEKLPFPGGGF